MQRPSIIDCSLSAHPLQTTLFLFPCADPPSRADLQAAALCAPELQVSLRSSCTTCDRRLQSQACSQHCKASSLRCVCGRKSIPCLASWSTQLLMSQREPACHMLHCVSADMLNNKTADVAMLRCVWEDKCNNPADGPMQCGFACQRSCGGRHRAWHHAAAQRPAAPAAAGTNCCILN